MRSAPYMMSDTTTRNTTIAMSPKSKFFPWLAQKAPPMPEDMGSAAGPANKTAVDVIVDSFRVGTGLAGPRAARGAQPIYRYLISGADQGQELSMFDSTVSSDVPLT